MSYPELMQAVQDALQMTDTEFANFLKTDATTVRRVRGGTAEVPAHTKLLLLDLCGCLTCTKLLASVFSPAIQVKLNMAIRTWALTETHRRALCALGESFLANLERHPDAFGTPSRPENLDYQAS